MTSRRVVRKSAAAKKKTIEHVSRGVDTPEEQKYDTQIVWSNNEEARRLGIDNTKPAQKLAKVVSLQISIGDHDRKRNMEDFVAYINKMLKAVPYGTDGLHASVMSSYYIVDGKVCTPQDFDEDKQNFADTKVPPSWAGGPTPRSVAKPAGERSSSSSAAISKASYDKKYGPEGSPQARAVIAAQKEAARKRREGPTDDELEEIDLEWDADDLDDDEKMEEVAAKSQKRAAVKIARKTTNGTPRKRVVTKKVATSNRRESASASPKTVRVVRRKK